MDEITGLAVAAAALGVAKPIVEAGSTLITNLLGKPMKVAGALLADQVYAYQMVNRIKIAAKTKVLIDDAGVDPKTIATGFLLPFFEAAGNVGNETMQDLWSKLLAGAIQFDALQHPMFIETLRRMGPSDAKVLLDLGHPPAGHRVVIYGQSRDENAFRMESIYARLHCLGLIEPMLVLL